MRLSITVCQFSVLVILSLTLGWSSQGQAQSADLSILKSDSPDPVPAGMNLTYTITVNNEGPDAAQFVFMEDSLPAGTTFVSLSAPAGWSCETPTVDSGGDVSCSIDPLAVGSSVFTLTVLVDTTVADGTVLSNTATVSSETADPNPGSESATVTTTVQAEVPVELQSFEVE
jgi:uncharacterized repeat protein (TIGR01451 family)